MAYYYRTPVIRRKNADGSEEISPDIPAGYNWVGNTDGKFYLIITDREIPPGPDRKRLMPIVEVAQEAKARGFKGEDVFKWSIGGTQ